jgi:hypothetical protein
MNKQDLVKIMSLKILLIIVKVLGEKIGFSKILKSLINSLTIFKGHEKMHIPL